MIIVFISRILRWFSGSDVLFTFSLITVVLCSGCFFALFRHLSRGQIDPRLWTGCKLDMFTFYFGRQYSSMLLVLMSIEKCFAVFFPLKAKTVCTVKTAKWATGIVGFILAGYDSLYLFVMKSEFMESTGRPACVYTVDIRRALLTVDSILYSYLQFALIVTTNTAIAFKFMRAKCKSNRSNSTESTNQALVKAATRGTAMVVTVSVTFLLLTAPTAVIAASHRLYWVAKKVHLYRVFMNTTQYLNHSINGILYCTVGSRFREEILKIICRSRKETRENSNSIIKTDTRT